MNIFHHIVQTSISGFMSPFWREPAKHIYRFITDREYRTYYCLLARYGGTPRYRKCRISVHGYKLTIPDVASFLSAFREIFVERIYLFTASTKSPRILDCGANVGVSILYFKRLYPESKIDAYEADPSIFRVLERNVVDNKIAGVNLVNKAVWDSETTIEFSQEGADAGSLITKNNGSRVRVETINLGSLLKGNAFDFVKIDIEGAEGQAVASLGTHDIQVPFVFIEFHSFSRRKQELSTLLSYFESQGYRVHVHPQLTSRSPFDRIVDNMYGMDMQLNLFFRKDRQEGLQ